MNKDYFTRHRVVDDIIEYIDDNVAHCEDVLNQYHDPFFAGLRYGLLSIKERIEFCPDCGGSGYLPDGRGSGEYCGCMGEVRFVKEERWTDWMGT